jgi:hypothetical protein
MFISVCREYKHLMILGLSLCWKKRYKYFS